MGFRYVSAYLLLADTAQLVVLRHAEFAVGHDANVCLDHVFRFMTPVPPTVTVQMITIPMSIRFP